MKLRFLGTSAAGGFPNPHCRCENCVAARESGGKSIRMMCSAMIDDVLLIDLGPDVNAACLRFDFDLADIEWVLQTHPHADHLLPIHAVARAASWAAKNAKPLEWFGTKQTVDTIVNGLGKAARKMNMVVDDATTPVPLRLTTVQPWQEIAFGNYRVQTIAANHDPSVDPMLFAIEESGRRLLWGSDTTSLPADTWPRIAALGWTFDVVVFDHNDGFTRDVSPTHMGSEGGLREMARMRELGIVNDDTRFIGTHIAHHSNSIHEVEDAKAQELGYRIAYDGLVVEI